MNEHAFSDWTQRRNVAHLSTNNGSASIAFQGWRPFKEAFAPELVAKAVLETSRELGRQVTRSSDPFGGSGTTALASQFLGVHPTTIEVNPFLADLIEAKLSAYKVGELERAFERIVAQARSGSSSGPSFPGAPPTFVEPGVDGRFLFWRSVAKRIAKYRSAIDDVSPKRVQRFFRVMLGAVLVPVSNVVVSGKGRRYRRGWQLRRPNADAVDYLFERACLQAIYDIRRHRRAVETYDLLRGDARTLGGSIHEHEVSVLSPPYPNSFDYTDVYNVELWALGYLENATANRRLREATLRSHVQIKRSLATSESASVTLSRVLEALAERRTLLWNRAIPEMVAAYFGDMRQVLGHLRNTLCSGGRAYVAVGDSKYAGIAIPVAKVLEEDAEAVGFEVLSAAPFRSMRASPQQGGRHDLDESLLVMRKP